MEEYETPPTLAARIRRRLDALHMTPRAASISAGLSDAFVRNILREKSASPRGTNLAALARTLRTTEIWLLRGEGPEEAAGMVPHHPELATKANVIPANVKLPAAESMPRDVPVFGTASASAVAKRHGFLLDTGKVVDHVRRPPALKGVPDAYAIYVVGESMTPMHEPGDLRFVDPHRPVRLGDSVIIQSRAGNGLPTEAFIKRFSGRTKSSVIAEQLKPKAIIEFKASVVTAVHKVLTMAELFEA